MNSPQKSNSPKKSPRTPTLTANNQQNQQRTQMANKPPEFKKKKFKKFFFRNYKACSEPGIVVFLLKQIKQEILENLIFEVFRKFYKGINLPSFYYFDSDKKVIQFKQIKPGNTVYFYITESNLDENNSFEIRYSDQQPFTFSTIEDQKTNLDLFIMRETEYMKYLNGNITLNPIYQSYAQLQFFLEKCYSDVWNYLEDFAEVSYLRRKRLVSVADNIDKKREEIYELTNYLKDILSEFEQQEEEVRQFFEKMGFSSDFVNKAYTLSSRQSQLYSNSQNKMSQQSDNKSKAFSQSSYQQKSFQQSQQMQPSQQYHFENSQVMNDTLEDQELNDTLEMFLPKNAKDI